MLIHGWKDGRIIELGALAADEWGIRCGCVCPNEHCRQRLVAKKRIVAGRVRKRRPHFAHESGSECEGASESALHWLAKQVIADEMAVMAPPVEIPVTGASTNLTRLRDAELLSFDEIGVEASCDGKRPDLACICRGEAIKVEIWVTHEADWTLLEIDLRDLVGTKFTAATLRERLLKESTRRRWVRHAAGESCARTMKARAESVAPGSDCPATLGTVPPANGAVVRSASLADSPCGICPALLGTEAGAVQCLWPAGIFAPADCARVVEGGRGHEPPFFSDQRKAARARAAELERLQARTQQVRGIGQSWRLQDANGQDGAADRDRLAAALAQISSEILRSYKRNPELPISYNMHLLDRSPDVEGVAVVATIHVGPDSWSEVRRGARPRDHITGEGVLFRHGDGYAWELGRRWCG